MKSRLIILIFLRIIEIGTVENRSNRLHCISCRCLCFHKQLMDIVGKRLSQKSGTASFYSYRLMESIFIYAILVSFIFTFLFLFIISAPACVSTSRCFEVVKACGDTSFGIQVFYILHFTFLIPITVFD